MIETSRTGQEQRNLLRHLAKEIKELKEYVES